MPKHQPGKNYLALRDTAENLDFGRLVADGDGLLSQYYVGHDRYLKRALDISDPAVFFIGSKGAGKSAVLQMVRLDRQADRDRVIDIQPDDLALSTINTIEATSPIVAEASKNQYIFKCLWDYVLAVEILRREYKETSGFANALGSLFRTKNERLARRLVEMSYDDGHATLTARIVQLIDELELGFDAGVVSGRVKTSPKEKQDATSVQILTLVTTVAKAIPKQLRHTYYILIDDLDRYWRNTPTQNAFIAALFDSLRHFSRSENIKASVALREEIYRQLPLNDRDKINDMVVRVLWDYDSVKKMITKRAVFKLRIVEAEVWGKLFPENSFDEIWNRSNGRPREAIRAASLAANVAFRNGRRSISDEDLRTAMAEFSSERITEVCDDVKHQYPGLQYVVRRMSGWPKEFPYKKLEELLEQLVLEVSIGEPGSERFDWVRNFESDTIRFANVLTVDSSVLWLKRSHSDNARPYDPSDHIEISSSTWFAIHPMFTLGLGLKGA